MTFAWPWMFAFLLLVPLLVLGYQRLLAARAARRTALGALGFVAPPVGRVRRQHVPFTLFLLALTLLLFALSRPSATVAQPLREGTVVLAFDVSSSMAATDLTPTRMAAAKTAARAFVDQQPSSVKIAVVAFGESGVITQTPTTDRTAVVAAIDRLAPQGGTALGRGIQTSLSAIAGKTVQLPEAGDLPEANGPDIGFYSSAAVVLLTDGENTDGPDPVAAAEFASTAGVRVFPIGLGSPEGSVLQIDGFSVSTALDEPTLRKIADTTDGTYFNAADEQSLTKVYSSIDLSWTVEKRHIEVTALFAAAAALLLLVGAGLSLAWFGRVI